MAAQGRFAGTLDDYLDRAERFLPPQVNFVSFRGRVLVGFVGRFEDLQGDFDHVCDWIGLPRYPLPNPPSTTQAQEGLLTPAICHRIERIYAADFQSFGYRRQ